MTISSVEMHNRVIRQLENSHIKISSENEWFKQCVDFFMSDNPNVIKIKKTLNEKQLILIILFSV